jgi:hypothetical protein
MAKGKDYAALAAHIGRQKYGKKRFQTMSAEGRERADKGGKKTWKAGGGKPFAAMKRALAMQDSSDADEKQQGSRAVRAMARARSAAQKRRAARTAGIKV